MSKETDLAELEVACIAAAAAYNGAYKAAAEAVRDTGDARDAVPVYKAAKEAYNTAVAASDAYHVALKAAEKQNEKEKT